MFMVIIGTIVWFALIKFVNKTFEIWATPKAWFMSWFIVVCIVLNISEGITESKNIAELPKEAEIFHGGWKTSDLKVGIRALDDDGDVVLTGDGGFLIAMYTDDGSALPAYVYPQKGIVHIEDEEGGEYDIEYKIKGLFFKKLLFDSSGYKTKYKKKSSNWEYYLD